jgi:antitoxin YefM
MLFAKSWSGSPPDAAKATSTARRNLFGLIQQVNEDHAPVEVVSKHGNAVLMSKDDYDAITETAYLLRNAKGAERLLASLERARRGDYETHELDEV